MLLIGHFLRIFFIEKIFIILKSLVTILASARYWNILFVTFRSINACRYLCMYVYRNSWKKFTYAYVDLILYETGKVGKPTLLFVYIPSSSKVKKKGEYRMNAASRRSSWIFLRTLLPRRSFVMCAFKFTKLCSVLLTAYVNAHKFLSPTHRTLWEILWQMRKLQSQIAIKKSSYYKIFNN